MTITAAQIEASGWVLRVTMTGSVGSFASYALDPDGSPKVSLACTHPGFAPSGGTAVATSLARTLVATKPLRKPANFSAGALQPFVVDETDNGDGTITVRLALSDYVHATETGVTASFAAGWRSGEAAATPTITNNSTFVAAVPIFRWSDVPYQRQAGAFAIELVAWSHHVQGLAPLAGVKFTVTDGTNGQNLLGDGAVDVDTPRRQCARLWRDGRPGDCNGADGGAAALRCRAVPVAGRHALDRSGGDAVDVGPRDGEL